MSTATALRSTRPRVLVLHPNLLVAQTLAAFLERKGSVREAQATDHVPQALDRARDVDVLLAERHSVPAGLDWHQHGPRSRGQLPTLVVIGDPGGSPGVEQTVTALRLGARACVPHDVPASVLVDVLETVGSGQLWLPPERIAAVVAALSSSDDSLGLGLGLTVRERSVLDLIGSGKTTAQIAELLYLSPHTVRTHRRNLFKKIGVHSALEAAAWIRRARAGDVVAGG